MWAHTCVCSAYFWGGIWYPVPTYKPCAKATFRVEASGVSRLPPLALHEKHNILSLPFLALMSICMQNKIHFNTFKVLMCFLSSTEGISWLSSSEDSRLLQFQQMHLCLRHSTGASPKCTHRAPVISVTQDWLSWRLLFLWGDKSLYYSRVLGSVKIMANNGKLSIHVSLFLSCLLLTLLF